MGSLHHGEFSSLQHVTDTCGRAVVRAGVSSVMYWRAGVSSVMYGSLTFSPPPIGGITAESLESAQLNP